MFTRILVPVDLAAKRNEPAVKVAARLGQQHDAAVSLIHVIRPIDGLERGEAKTFRAELEARTRKALAAHARLVAKAGVPVEEVVTWGEPVAEVLQAVKRGRHDLIVLASHRIDPKRPAEGWGTMSHKLAVLAPCPVLLVK